MVCMPGGVAGFVFASPLTSSFGPSSFLKNMVGLGWAMGCNDISNDAVVVDQTI